MNFEQKIMESFRQYITRSWIYIVFVLIAILLKFYHIGNRYFWLDEISTIEQTSGLNRDGMMNLVPENEIVNISYYKSMLRLNEHNLTIGSQLKSQANTMNLNPLHYSLLTFWHRIAGDEPIHYRYFSLFIFLLTLPFVYLLANKLFNFKLSGWIALSLFSTFAYFHYYTHEARYIMLCTFLIVSCGYFFMIASDQNKFKWWLAYVITGIMALYSSVILGLMILGQSIYVLLFRRKIFLSFLFSFSIIFLLFLPWLIFIVNSYSEVSGAMAWHELYNDNLNVLELIYMQLMMMSRSLISFIDINTWFYGLNGHHFHTLFYIFIAIIITGSIIYAKRKMKPESFYFVFFLLLPSFLFFLLTDLIRGAGTSLISRYHYITVVAILLFLSFFFTRKISNKKISYFILYSCILVLGAVSNIRISQNKTWDIYPHYDFAPAKYINNTERYLLISDFTTPMNNGITAFLMLINEIKTDNVDILYISPDNKKSIIEVIENNYPNIIALYTSEQLLEHLKSQFVNQVIQIESLELYNPVWQINNSSQRSLTRSE